MEYYSWKNCGKYCIDKKKNLKLYYLELLCFSNFPIANYFSRALTKPTSYIRT